MEKQSPDLSEFINYSTIATMLPAIAVFAKAPIPGRVKTRLAVTLGNTEAAKIYEQMVSLLLQRLHDASDKLPCNVELHTDIPTDAWTAFPVTRHLQSPGDLGQRMFNTLQSGLKSGQSPLLILGGDVPTVPIPYLQTLLSREEDLAIGPAEDGGYYAISARATHPDMFAGVEWSTPNARQQTITACHRAGLSVWVGPMWFDIDEPSDLARI
jgi:rSAM/selenodomain-associated transferase 1